MIQPLYTQAVLDPRYANTFIQAAHKCESLMDKAMTDGKKLSRKTFLEECNSLTGAPRFVATFNRFLLYL